jgi:hypothetical protein
MAMAFTSTSEPRAADAMPFDFGGGGSGLGDSPLAFDDADSLPAGPAVSTEPQYNKGNKPVAMEGDFKPQELAQGIRTILSGEK